MEAGYRLGSISLYRQRAIDSKAKEFIEYFQHVEIFTVIKRMGKGNRGKGVAGWGRVGITNRFRMAAANCTFFPAMWIPGLTMLIEAVINYINDEFPYCLVSKSFSTSFPSFSFSSSYFSTF